MRKAFILLFLLALIFGCSSSDDSSDGGTTTISEILSYAGYGYVQAGPPQIGSVAIAACMAFNSTLGKYVSAGDGNGPYTTETSDM